MTWDRESRRHDDRIRNRRDLRRLRPRAERAGDGIHQFLRADGPRHPAAAGAPPLAVALGARVRGVRVRGARVAQRRAHRRTAHRVQGIPRRVESPRARTACEPVRVPLAARRGGRRRGAACRPVAPRRRVRAGVWLLSRRARAAGASSVHEAAAALRAATGGGVRSGLPHGGGGGGASAARLTRTFPRKRCRARLAAPGRRSPTRGRGARHASGWPPCAGRSRARARG